MHSPLPRCVAYQGLSHTAQRLKCVYAQLGESPDQAAQHRRSRSRVIERTMAWRAGTKEFGERGEPAVAHLVGGEQLSRKRRRVQCLQPRQGQIVRGARGIKEADVEWGVVRDEHGAGGELDEPWQRVLDPWRGCDKCIVDASKHRDMRRDGTPWIDQGGELLIGHIPAALAAAAGPHCGKLGNRRMSWRPACRLQIDDHEVGLRYGAG